MRTTVGLERLSVCAHQYELAETLPPTARTEYPGAMYLGSCFHKAMEYYFRERLADLSPSEEQVIEAFKGAWDTGQPLPDGLTMANVAWGESEHPETTAESSLEDGIEMLKLYLPTASTIWPARVEFSGEVEVDDEPIEFHIDLLTSTKHLVDLKTGRRAKSQLDVDISIQLSVYAWGLRKLGIWEAQDEQVEIHSIVRHQKIYKTGKPNPEPYKLTVVGSRRNLINYEWIDEIFIPRLIAMKKAGAFPANPGIHCAYCLVREHCGHWESVRTGRET